MASAAEITLASIWNIFYILSGLCWIVPLTRLIFHLIKPKPRDLGLERLQQTLRDAKNYDEWLQAAEALDDYLPENTKWKHQPISQLYHWQQIQQRIAHIQEAMSTENFQDAYILLQFGMVRGLGSIADPRLYNRIYVGTKFLIEDYISTMLGLIDSFFEWTWKGKSLPHQAKVDHAERFRIAFGKTGLVLQGGSIFGLYHIGVMKALHERALLPRVILGTGTGAIMAALVGIHTDAELPQFLRGQGINLSAFTDRLHQSHPKWYEVIFIFLKRLKRFYQSGYVLDREALERCVEDNVGDMTFRQAHERTGRIISISIEGDSPGTPNALNYLTTPHVLIRTAAMASNESDPDKAPAMILQRYPGGVIEPWSINDESPAFRKWRRKHRRRKLAQDLLEAPLHRVSQLENINHFIISQARPYLVPFLAPSLHRSNTPRARRADGIWSLLAFKDWLIRSAGKEIAHRMSQFDRIFGLPRRLRRFLIDEKIPFRSLTLVPEVQPSDFLRLLQNPTTDEIDHWIALGEKSVWPCVSALEVRCKIEFALQDRYKIERRRPLHQIYREEQMLAANGLPRRRTRVRSTSAESNPI